MERNKNSSSWLEEGYQLFAHEGMEGIQVERLARILCLNKSGFYHYFGDIEGYCSELIGLHEKKAHDYLRELRTINSIDPDYFGLLIRYKVPAMFQVQVLRDKRNTQFYNVAEYIDNLEDGLVQTLWSKYLGLEERPNLALRYFKIVRDVFYARISFDNFDKEYLRNLFTETKEVMQQLSESNVPVESGGSVY